MLVHTSVFIFVTILIVGYGEAKNIKYGSKFCSDVKTPLDLPAVVGIWYLVATMQPMHIYENRTFSYDCFTMELTGVLNENSKDLIVKTEDADDIYLRDIEGKDGMKKSRGCYQPIKSLDGKIVEIQSFKDDILVVQFFLMETSERFLVQNVWQRGETSSLIYSKNEDFHVTEEDLQPVKDFVTKVRGEEQALEFVPKNCHAEINDIPENEHI